VSGSSRSGSSKQQQQQQQQQEWHCVTWRGAVLTGCRVLCCEGFTVRSSMHCKDLL
jgi:hypothetical protein